MISVLCSPNDIRKVLVSAITLRLETVNELECIDIPTLEAILEVTIMEVTIRVILLSSSPDPTSSPELLVSKTTKQSKN